MAKEKTPWTIHTQFDEAEKKRILKLKAAKYPTGRITDKAFVEELTLAGLQAEEKANGGDKA